MPARPCQNPVVVSFEKCFCTKCGQHIEFPLEGMGMTVPCPTCSQPVVLSSGNPPTTRGPITIPPTPIENRKERKTHLKSLTELTIRKTTQRGETPLHRAAKLGRFSEIPHNLLSAELFLAQDYRGETPLHFAAKHGSLYQVPSEFLTAETLTVRDRDGNTPLHTAAYYGQAAQIPKAFLSSDFLRIPRYFSYGGELHGGESLFHILVSKHQLSLIPPGFITPELWRLKDHYGRTPADALTRGASQEAWREEPSTDKQKEKLRWFGCTWDGEITKGQASDAITECVRQFPEKDADYYNRPATGEQLKKLRPYLRRYGEVPDDYAEPGKPLTYGEAKDLISDCEIENRP